MNDYSAYPSVLEMLGRLCWCTLGQWRADSRLVLFYKIVNDLPTYILPLNQYSQTTKPLASDNSMLGLILVFRLAVVQWNNLSTSTPSLTNLDNMLSIRSATSEHEITPLFLSSLFLVSTVFNMLTLCIFILFSPLELFLT